MMQRFQVCCMIVSDMDGRVKHLAVLGSTGSIGRQTLEVVRAFPERFQVVALAAGSNRELLAQQAREFHPRFVWAGDLEGWALTGSEPLAPEAMAAHPEVDLVVVATSGKAGLAPTLEALRAGKRVALANKEVLVMAGELVTAEARQHRATILPIDSEHSAIWQCLEGEGRDAIRIILTASGGPFRDTPLEELARVTAADALRHPTWQMGKKVTIDSSTLMNKGMEAIEARWLFGVPLERISVVIHKESMVHSLVEFCDGSVKAQLSCPDMRLPIQYALSYPERWPNPAQPCLELSRVGSLTFHEVDWPRFPCLKLALEAGRRGGTYPAVLCAADEVAVGLFLSRGIGFLDIPRLVGEALEQHRSVSKPSLEEIMAADAWAREKVVARLVGRPSQVRGKPC